MAVATAFDYHMCRLFKRCISSLPALHASSLLHVSAPPSTGKGAKTLTTSRASRQPLCPQLFNVFSQKHTKLHKWCHMELQYSHIHSSHSSTCLHRLDYPHTFSQAHLNSVFKITSLLNGTTTRGFHGSPKFTIKNPLYSSYLDSLVREYNVLMENQSTSHNTEMAKDQVLRFKFLRSAVETIKRIQEKHSEARELAVAINGKYLFHSLLCVLPYAFLLFKPALIVREISYLHILLVSYLFCQLSICMGSG